MTGTSEIISLRTRLETGLGGAARAWLDQATAEAAAHRERPERAEPGPTATWE
ncbi:sugar phosphate isomerase, partial [Streptomyces sp. SID10116]|nr:sugar phosphate isomerase [Streptomyces sp. SID10116]